MEPPLPRPGPIRPRERSPTPRWWPGYARTPSPATGAGWSGPSGRSSPASCRARPGHAE